MDSLLPEELVLLRRTVRSFVEDRLRPLERQVEIQDHLDSETFRLLREEAVALGLYAHNLPEAIGGGGLSVLGQVMIGEELGRTTMALADAVGFLPASLAYANESQREWFLDPVLGGRKCVAYALTEASGGSDLGGIRTRAERSGSEFIINGSKQFISGADFADFIIVLAITDPSAKLSSRFTLFIVDRNDPGFHYLGNFRKMGWRGYQIGAFSLQDCRVAEDHVLGTVGGGFGAIMDTINTSRIQYAGRYVGMAEELLTLAIAYGKERKTFGQALTDHQALQFSLADCDVEIEAARLLAYRAAALADEGAPQVRIAASRAKLYASEMVGRVADRVVQFFGGAGYVADFPVERMYRDARAFRIGEGTSEMHRIQIARHILR